MNCQALLEHIAVLKGLDKQARKSQIENLLALTNLSQVAKKKVSDFSGGMRQRFGIAQALLGNPQLIIMDEPTAGLDPMERESLNNMLVTISKDRLVLLSTHIVEDIENLCNYVAIINKGTVIESGDVKALLLPLNDKVWHIRSLPSSFPSHYVLSKSYRYGESAFRVYSEQAPTADASLVRATLQDKYFFELNMQKVNAC
jgi:ABC-type multidrug transport system ATPase subunit